MKKSVIIMSISDIGGIDMNYAKAIRYYREKKLITQVELANILGVSFASVNRWEKGRFQPTMKAKRKLKKLFDEEGIEVKIYE